MLLMNTKLNNLLIFHILFNLINSLPFFSNIQFRVLLRIFSSSLLFYLTSDKYTFITILIIELNLILKHIKMYGYNDDML